MQELTQKRIEAERAEKERLTDAVTAAEVNSFIRCLVIIMLLTFSFAGTPHSEDIRSAQLPPFHIIAF